MFWKLVTWEVDNGDAENGPGQSYEEVWAVCRASTEYEAKIILYTFLKAFGYRWPENCEIKEADQIDYEEYLEYELKEI